MPLASNAEFAPGPATPYCIITHFTVYQFLQAFEISGNLNNSDSVFRGGSVIFQYSISKPSRHR